MVHSTALSGQTHQYSWQENQDTPATPPIVDHAFNGGLAWRDPEVKHVLPPYPTPGYPPRTPPPPPRRFPPPPTAEPSPNKNCSASVFVLGMLVRRPSVPTAFVSTTAVIIAVFGLVVIVVLLIIVIFILFLVLGARSDEQRPIPDMDASATAGGPEQRRRIGPGPRPVAGAESAEEPAWPRPHATRQVGTKSAEKRSRRGVERGVAGLPRGFRSRNEREKFGHGVRRIPFFLSPFPLEKIALPYSGFSIHSSHLPSSPYPGEPGCLGGSLLVAGCRIGYFVAVRNPIRVLYNE